MSEFKEVSDDTHAKAGFMFDMLLQITGGDGEQASSIIMSLMVNLWLIGAADKADLNAMLSDFALGVRTNIDMARTNDQRTAN